MAKLHLICGLPGSGKTTLARDISASDAVWLSPDQWMARIVGTGYAKPQREAIEHIQWELAERFLLNGVDVVLDNGFWTRNERSRYRSAAEAIGSEVVLHFLDVPLDELKRRIAARRAAPEPFSFPVSEPDLEAWALLFEKPSADELSDRDHGS